MATVFTIKRQPKHAPAQATQLLCQGTALHLPLQDNSVHCCVTSPPYYGLRDYGTGTWSGGDPACTHSPSDTPLRRGLATSTLVGGKANTGHQQEGYKHLCPRCSAVRVDSQLGLETAPDTYVRVMAQVFREVKRVLRDDGVLFLNIGDTYWGGGGGNYGSGKAVKGREGVHLTNVRNRQKLPGIPAKNLIGIPWRVALALQRSGWILRSEIIWEKTNAMPESVKDRPTKSHEQVFLFSKQERYFYDQEAIKEPTSPNTHMRSSSVNGQKSLARSTTEGVRRSAPFHGYQPATRNARSVWTFPTEAMPHAHFATFPRELVRRCLLAGAPMQVCSTCGAPWVRVVERVRFGQAESATKFDDSMQGGRLSHSRQARRVYGLESPPTPVTLGFTPTCTCLGGIAKSVILDPFCGSGTTLQVSRELGHHAIGVDLSWPYLHTIARRRLGAVPNL